MKVWNNNEPIKITISVTFDKDRYPYIMPNRWPNPILYWVDKSWLAELARLSDEWRRGEHIWEKDPFEEDISDWRMKNWWANYSCNGCLCQSSIWPDWKISECYTYMTYWWDHLEWRMYISRRFGSFVTAECMYWMNWRIEYKIDHWKLIERVDVPPQKVPDEFITKWSDLKESLVTFSILRAIDYDRLHNRL